MLNLRLMSNKLSPIFALIEALRVLPGIGPRSAKRIAMHLLHYNREDAKKLGSTLSVALRDLKQCRHCSDFTNSDVCDICADPKRDPSMLCIVETPADLLVVEQTQTYRGLYFILMGHLSPLDGIGPKEINIDLLVKRVEGSQIREVILATNFTSEGEATAYYVAQVLKSSQVSVSRLAKGVPFGGELEYVDTGTVAGAFLDRKII